MKKLFFVFLFVGHSLWAQQKTTTIEFEDSDAKKVVKIISNDKEEVVVADVLKLGKMNLKNVLRALDVDSLEREKALVLVSKTGSVTDTLFVLNRKGNEIRIVAKDLAGLINTGGQVQAENDEIKTFESDETETKTTNGSSGRKGRYSGKYYSNSDFELYLGLNSYTNSPNDLADLRVWPSKYVSIALKRNVTLSKSASVHTVFTFGPEFAWHNFMLENSNKLIYEGGQADFVKNSSTTSKSKFVVPHLMLPGMVRFGFKKSNFNLGLGGYIGYRTGAYTKEKLDNPKSKKVNKDQSLGLENLKYGLAVELGRKNASLFFRYDLSPLFKENQKNVTDMNAFSFGVKLF